MELLLILPITFAVISWFVAVGSWALSLSHLVEGVSVKTMIFNGMKSFDSSNFTDEGKKHQSRFLKGFGLFVLFVLISGVGSVLLEQFAS